MNDLDQLKAGLHRVPPEVVEDFYHLAKQYVAGVNRALDSYAGLSKLKADSQEAFRLDKVATAAKALKDALSSLEEDEITRLLRAGDDVGAPSDSQLPVSKREVEMLERMANTALENKVSGGRPTDYRGRRLAEAVTRAWVECGIGRYYKRSTSYESPYSNTLNLLTGETIHRKIIESTAHDNWSACTPPKTDHKPHRSD